MGRLANRYGCKTFFFAFFAILLFLKSLLPQFTTYCELNDGYSPDPIEVISTLSFLNLILNISFLFILVSLESCEGWKLNDTFVGKSYFFLY